MAKPLARTCAICECNDLSSNQNGVCTIVSKPGFILLVYCSVYGNCDTAVVTFVVLFLFPIFQEQTRDQLNSRQEENAVLQERMDSME